MRVRSRTVQAAGVMSFALVAAARVARDARTRGGVTCVRVPGRPLESAPALGVRVAPAIADGSVPAIALDDPAVAQPTAVMPAVTTVAAAPAPASVEAAPAPVEAAPAPKAAPPATAQRPEAEPPPAEAMPARPPASAPALARQPPPEPLPPPDPTWGWSEPWSFELPGPDAPTRRAATRRKPTRRTPTRRPAHHPPTRARQLNRPPRRGRPILALAVIVLAVAISAWIVVPRSAPASAHPTADVSHLPTPRPSAFALRAIPSAYLGDYWRAATEYGLDWTKLAAVGQIESDQGRSRVPGVGAGTNPAGAAGPAQFLGSTWARYGVDADGRGSSNPYDPADAITAMAAYLKASGAPQDWRAALFAYNHSSAYVDSVLALSRRYLGP
jgi:hypothetical protein